MKLVLILYWTHLALDSVSRCCLLGLRVAWTAFRVQIGLGCRSSYILYWMFGLVSVANTTPWSPPLISKSFPVLEIVGPQGTTMSATVTVPIGATKLWLRVNGLGYTNKGSVQINLAGGWTPFNNTTCTFDYPASLLNGIGGPLSSLCFTMPSIALKPGKMVVTFRFDSSDLVSNGYRVLGINLLDAQGNRLLAETTPALVLNNKIYSTGEIAAGAWLWTNAALRASWSGPSILATCSDCHARDGSDLKYFGYSDYAIGERARFHGLTSTQQRQVTAFIRNNPESALGTPWDPPYQPGPGQSELPFVEWAAGAGLKWVTPADSNSWDYIFADAPAQFSFTNTLNIRDIPISTPLPVWAEWLPRISPADAFGPSFQPLTDIYNRMLLEPDASVIVQLMSQWMGTYVNWAGANTTPNDSANKTDQVKTWSAARWMTVKSWEIMHTHRMEGRAQEMYDWPVDSHCWPNNAVFLSAPHFTLPHSGHILGDGSELTWGYRTHQWYWEMMLLNDSNHRRGGAGPVDWPYLLGFSTIPSSYGVDSTAQTVLALVKSGESGTGNPLVWDDAFFGWAVSRTEFLDSYGKGMWQNYDPAVRDGIVRAFLREYDRNVRALGREYFRDLTHEIADGETDNFPAPPSGGPWIKEHSSIMLRMAADGFATDIHETMYALAEYLWPDADWSPF